MFTNMFSFSGRITRIEYLISLLISCFICFIVYAIFGAKVVMRHGHPPLKDTICYLLIFTIVSWFMLAQGVKRCHDTDRSGWYFIAPYYFLVFIFWDPDPYDNEYGIDPRDLFFLETKRSKIYIPALITIAVLIFILAKDPSYYPIGSR